MLSDPLALSVIGNVVLAGLLGMLSVHHYHTTKRGRQESDKK